MFANRYLDKNKKEPLIKEIPNPDLGVSVVIPCYLEPDIVKTLNTVSQCQPPEKSVEIIIVLNHSEIESEKNKQVNNTSKLEIQSWIKNHQSNRLKFFVVGPLEFKKKWAGVGLARKNGMDEAVSRFNQGNNPDGIIVSLDADTLVKKNYLVAIEKHFINNSAQVGATIKFSHQTDGLEDNHRKGILLYENYQAYYKEAMAYTGYPFAMFTVGSAFAVKAAAYVKRGGMNRRQAGEDFYFLQNLAQMGEIGEITETTVFPSARLSDRVPFGTGPAMQKWMKGEGQLTRNYNFKAFKDLKLLFDQKENFYQISEHEYLSLLKELPKPVQEFLMVDNFWNELKDLNRNCSNSKSFQKRFYQKFNAFKILKFLNFAHEHFFDKAILEEQVQLLKKAARNNPGSLQ